MTLRTREFREKMNYYLLYHSRASLEFQFKERLGGNQHEDITCLSSRTIAENLARMDGELYQRKDDERFESERPSPVTQNG